MGKSLRLRTSRRKCACLMKTPRKSALVCLHARSIAFDLNSGSGRKSSPSSGQSFPFLLLLSKSMVRAVRLSLMRYSKIAHRSSAGSSRNAKGRIVCFLVTLAQCHELA